MPADPGERQVAAKIPTGTLTAPFRCPRHHRPEGARACRDGTTKSHFVLTRSTHLSYRCDPQYRSARHGDYARPRHVSNWTTGLDQGLHHWLGRPHSTTLRPDSHRRRHGLGAGQAVSGRPRRRAMATVKVAIVHPQTLVASSSTGKDVPMRRMQSAMSEQSSDPSINVAWKI